MAKIIGIDLGTTNSCVAVMEGGKPKLSSLKRKIPFLRLDRLSGCWGRCQRQMVVNQKYYFSIKRLMGRRFSDESVKFDAKWLPYKIKSGRDEMADVEVDGKTYTPQKFQQ